MSSTLSIYIPRMSIDHDVESVTNIMENYSIGTVSHVDFTPINQKPGFNENTDNNFKSAFVHFSDPSPVNDDNYRYSSRFSIGNANFWNIVLYTNGPYKLQISTREFWLCLENKNPVQRTMMNIHQVVENCRYLENLIDKQAKIIEIQSKTIQHQYKSITDLEYRFDGVHQALSQLIGGLFCKETQPNILSKYDMILRGYSRASDEPDTHNSGHYPTTRQGDKNESRINYLEQQVKSILIFDNPEETQDDEEIDDISVITHSSMPELEDMDSIS
jgi:hypothetical protein